MANSTILQLVSQASGEMGLSVPSTVVGNPTQDVLQMRYLIQAVGNELSRERDWQTLITEYRFPLVYYTYTGTTTDGSTSVTSMSSTTGLTTTPTYFMVTGTGIPQDTYLTAAGGGTVTLSNAATASGTAVSLTFSQTKYAYPSDYDRPIDRTQWDKSRHWEMLGPETQQQAQWLKAGYISTGPRIRYYPAGGFFQVWPPTGTDDSIGFSYISKNWILATSDVVTPSKAAYTADTDTCIFPDSLMVTGLKWRWALAKGMEQTPIYQREYQRELDIAKTSDAGSPTLAMAPQPASVLLTFNNIPDANYNV